MQRGIAVKLKVNNVNLMLTCEYSMQANHKFGENNAVLVTAFHPLLSKVGAVVVTEDMEAGEEVESTFNVDTC